MEQAVVVDLKRLVMYSELYMERFCRDFPEHEDRLMYDRRMRDDLRDYLYNRFWNILGESANYEIDELEEDLYLGRIFDGWKANCWYRDGNKELVVEDMGAFKFNCEFVEEMDDMMKVIISKERLQVGFSILEIDISKYALTVDIYGDWRAQQWCMDNDQEYQPT